MREFYLKRDGLQIYACEFLPDAAKFPAPAVGRKAVILSHGFGSKGSDIWSSAEFLQEHGFAAYTYDFCGGSVPGTGKSDGRDVDMTAMTEVADLKAVYEYVAAKPGIDPAGIYLAGFSQGGYVSALAAAELREKIAGIVLIYPAFCIPDHARAGMLGGASYDPANPPTEIHCPNGMTLGPAMFRESYEMDPFLKASGYRGDVLIIHGLDDKLVNYSYAVKLAETYRSVGAKYCGLQLVREQGHGLSEGIQHEEDIAMLQFLLGKRELLTIHVTLTADEVVEAGDGVRRDDVYFTGYCDNELFSGTILPGGCDHQTRVGGGAAELHAVYTLHGIDRNGKICNLQVDNARRGEFFSPVIRTESEDLAFLNGLKTTAIIEGYSHGVTIRIFG